MPDAFQSDATESGTFESGVGQVRHCPWVVCENGHRFATAAFRFAPAMTPGDAVPLINSTTIANCREPMEPFVRSGFPCVLMLSFELEETLPVLDLVMWLASHPSQILQRSVFSIVACDRLSRSGELALAETGVSVFLRHPEDLPKYAPVVHAHFASFASALK